MQNETGTTGTENTRPARTGRAAFVGRVQAVTAPLTPDVGGEARIVCDDGKTVRAEGLSAAASKELAARFGGYVVLIGEAFWGGNGRMVSFRPDRCEDDVSAAPAAED